MDLYKQSSLTAEQLAEIRKLHFYTKHLVTEGVTGQYRSAFRGRGMEFEEVREYHPGDDVRSIDWKVTARTNSPYVKLFREERELTVMIAVDVSASTFTGTRSRLREGVIAQIGAALTLMALNNNDKVGLVTFSDQLESYHPPRKGKNAVWRILQEVLGTSETRPKTNLTSLFEFLNGVLKRHTIVFILSDFFDSGFEKPLAALSKRHDVTAIIVRDPADIALPQVGFLRVSDPETGKQFLIDTNNRRVQESFKEQATRADSYLRTLCDRYGVNSMTLQTHRPFMPELRNYFARRESRVLSHS